MGWSTAAAGASSNAMAAIASSAPNRRRCGSPRCRRPNGTRPTGSSSPRRTRMAGALVLSPPRARRRLAARLARGALHRKLHALSPPGLLSRHGAGLGLAARTGRGRQRCGRGRSGLPQPVRLYRGGQPGARGRRCGGHACRRLEEIGRAGARECRARRHDRAADPLDRRRRRQVRGARGAARTALRRHPARPAQVRARPERRALADRGGLAPLLADCRHLLDADSRALFLTVYAVRMSALAIGELLAQLFADLPGKVECGELAVREEARGLLLPTAIFARWSRHG